ncbi:MAG: hypothetical protein WBA57_04130 [Elainellaceae cyanobacterium]
MASSELARPPYDFGSDNAFIHKGFRVGKSVKGEYSWRDVRFDDYYEEVDPLITEKVLELGFVKALTLVMIHNDHDKIIQLDRRIININNEIEHWVVMATEIYNEKRRETAKINRSKTLSPETKKKRKATLMKKYNKNKALFEKRRRILKAEKDDVKIDRNFYSSRIRAFKN